MSRRWVRSGPLGGQDDAGHEDGEYADGHVHEEDHPPAQVERVELDQRAPDHLGEHHPHAAGGGEDGEALDRSAGGNTRWITA